MKSGFPRVTSGTATRSSPHSQGGLNPVPTHPAPNFVVPHRDSASVNAPATATFDTGQA
jgi:hypothetical protein